MDKLIIRTSDRLTFKRCRTLWDFSSKIRQNYEPLRPKDYFEFGTAWHAAMEVWYAPKALDLPGSGREIPFLSAGRERLSWIAFHAVNRDQLRRLEELGLSNEEIELEYKQREELGMKMLNFYFQWSRIHDDFEPVTVEHEFEVPIMDLTDHLEMFYCQVCNELNTWADCSHDKSQVFYQGRIDGLVRDLAGNLWLLEHKTASKEGGTNWLMMDEQTGSYIWAFEKMLDVRIMGVIRTVAYKRAPEPPRVLKDGSVSVDKRQSTTAELFMQTIEKAYGFQPVVQTITEVPKYQEYHKFLTNPDVAPKFIERSQLQRNHNQIEDIGQRIALEAEDMLSSPHIYPNVSPMNCNPCAFFSPCLMRQEGSDWEYELNSSYRRRGG